MVSRVKRYFLEIKDFSKTVDLNLPENFQIILKFSGRFKSIVFEKSFISKKYLLTLETIS